MDKKHNIVYKLTNLQNGHYYIGKHTTDNINDGYMGSGVLIIEAIKKYGVDNFKKEILFDFSSEKEALEKEQELMPLEKTNYFDKKCYNLVEGGQSGIMTEETKEKIRQTNQQYCGEKHSQYGKPKSQSTKDKISETLATKTKGENNGMFGEKLSDHMSPEKYDEWKKSKNGCKFYNNGTTEIMIKPTETPPDGFIMGRLPSSLEKLREYNKTHKKSLQSIQKMVETKRKNGTLKRTQESIQKQIKTREERHISSITTANCKWFNDGINEKMFKPNEQIPFGWTPGRLINKHYKWYNNGVVSKRFDSTKSIPSGFVLGRLKSKK